MNKKNEMNATGETMINVDDMHKTAFLRSVHDYRLAPTGRDRAKLISAMLQSISELADKDGILPMPTRESVLCIKDQYGIFGPCDERSDLTTYRDAQRLLSALFF
jgi:hypothetical protein